VEQNAAPRWKPGPLILLLSLAGLFSTILGVLAHRQYVRAELHLRASFAEATAVGAERDVEQCITWVLDWMPRCAAAKAMCEAAVPGLTETCLASQDRGAYCDQIGASSDTHWSFAHCTGRGLSRRDHACASAYLAVDAYCHQRAGPHAS